MKSKEKADAPKRLYSEPRLKVIELAAEEILGVGCKVAEGGAAPMGFTCTAMACAEAAS
jgi:hypothetical protein